MGIRKIIVGISVFIMALLITSCSGNESAVLQDDTCKVPCWRNIEMGKTGVEQTIELLNQMPDVDPNTIRQGKNPQTGVEGVSAGFLNDESNLELRFQNGKVFSMFFSFEKDISLADAIKKFGTPTYIYPTGLRGDPFAYITVDFWYPDLGVCLHHENKRMIIDVPTKYRISGRTNITQIYYVDSSFPQGQMTFGCLKGGNESELNLERQEWKGYTEYPIP